MPRISIIVPVYKVEKYIHRCVDSILDQTFTDFELILVDDGSPDNCGSICDAYARTDSHVVVIHQENGGLSAARNAGLDWVFANSDSQWISFVDSDDWVHPEYLQKLWDAAAEHPVSVSICGYFQTDGAEPEIMPESLISTLWIPEEFHVKHNLNATVAWGKLYRRECFREIRYPLGKLYEDGFTTYKILFETDAVAVVAAPLYAYFMNSEGITKSGITRFRMDGFEALEEQIRFFHNRNFDRAERARICDLLQKLQYKMEWFRENPGANPEFLRQIKKMRINAWMRYIPRLKPNEDLDGWTLTRIFPKTMWVYWHMRAALRKLRIIK